MELLVLPLYKNKLVLQVVGGNCMANKSTLKLDPVETTRASVVIYEQIKEKILNGELKPGDYLPSERNMMEMLQRSRPTIREALRMLEQSGFIKTTIGTAGPVVQEYKLNNLAVPMENILKINDVSNYEVFEYRKECERFVVAWAAKRRSEEDLLKMQQILDETEKCISEKHYDMVLEYDLKFHEAIYKASKNRVAEILNSITHDITENSIEIVLNNASEKEKQSLCKKILKAHIAIYDSIKSKDEKVSKEAITQHLESFSKDYQAYK